MTSTSRSRLPRWAQAALALMVLLLLIPAGLALSLYLDYHRAARADGSFRIAGLRAPVEVRRDERFIPHVRAQNEHDLFLAQGFLEGSDRLFQMDLTRHFVYGRLAEWFGAQALAADEHARQVPVAEIVEAQYNRLKFAQRAHLQAFADGVNAAMQMQPRPFEYRLLFVAPQPWSAQDSLAVGFATVLDLADSYKDVIDRDWAYRAGPQTYERYYPLTDPKYDVPIVGSSLTPRYAAARTPLSWARGVARADKEHPGSNNWAVGAAHSATGRPLLANDPHLDLRVPGIWYLIDLQSPTFHAAGASLAGTPGIILGHNDHIAWGATNGTVAAVSVYHRLPNMQRAKATFNVRFSKPVIVDYFQDKNGFVVRSKDATKLYVEWRAYSHPLSPLIAFEGLDRASNMRDALSALSRYPGPTQNFVLASTEGAAAYTLAGEIPNDALWGTHIHDDAPRDFAAIPFAALPHVAASRNAVVFTANNKMYGAGYPYRLSATFAPPYRAYRIWQTLHQNKKFTVADFAKLQLDTVSVPEREIALHLALAFDGNMAPDSMNATAVHEARVAGVQRYGSTVAYLQELRAHGSNGRYPSPLPARSWGQAGAIHMENPLHSLGITWLDGPDMPGNGDNFTLHVQSKGFSQSFRAVWDVGNWDGGGIVIPAGESGQPGSPHYLDLHAQWMRGDLAPLWWSQAAINSHTSETQNLLPSTEK